ncbi:Cleavage and polyadenylation specificity factor subunit 1 [Fasciolopsis buskii]|uniref:Cleavage and polyadenylation specificity factor subunit 1 n=1 Tax=Fasciolopsis buskii TaxID=27845 RepID=A0A8E0RP84_9TREM|nr:Cleavage and polyadenylation specificity factor subunit 1 [Fasciolopsis buski]
MVLVGSSNLFIGSRLCDSVLMRCNVTQMTVDTLGKPVVSDLLDVEMQPRVPIGDNPDHNAEIRNESENADEPKETMVDDPVDDIKKNPAIPEFYEFDEVDVELYGDAILNPPSKYRKLDSYNFKVVDRLSNFGPMGMLTSGEVPCLAPGNTDPTDDALMAAQAEMQHVELIACIPRSFNLSASGNDIDKDELRSGGVLLLHTTVRSRGLTAFELPEYMSLWSLYGPPIVTNPISKNEPGSGQNSTKDGTQLDVTETDAVAPRTLKEKAESEVTKSMNTDKPESVIPEEPPTSVDILTSEKNSVAGSDPSPSVTGRANSSSNQISSPAGPGLLEDLCSDPKHSYLLLTRDDSTMILEVSHEIVELEVSGFNTTEMTVAAVNLGGVYIKQMSRTTQVNPVTTSGTTFTDAVTNKRKMTTDSNEINSKRQRVGYDYPYILQVSPTSLRLLDGPKLLEYVQVTLEWRIHLASAADPFVLLCTEDDELFLVRLQDPHEVESFLSTVRFPQKKPWFLDLRSTPDASGTGLFGTSLPSVSSTPHLEIFRPKVRQVSAPACFCLYHDRGGKLSHWLWSRRIVPEGSGGGPVRATPGSETGSGSLNAFEFFPAADAAAFAEMTERAFQPLSTSEEEDLLLYGELIELCKRERGEPQSKQPTTSISQEQPMDTEVTSGPREDGCVRSNYFAFILFTNGVLEIYGLPEFTLLYEVHHFTDLPSMLYDHRGWRQSSSNNGPCQFGATQEEESMPPTVLEIAVFPTGRNFDRPILVARTSQEVALFEALCPAPTEAHPLAGDCWIEEGLRWRRLPIPCSLVAPRRVRTDPKIADVHATLISRAHMLRSFENIGGHSGVFVSGASPMWLFGTQTGQIRVFPHAIDGIMGSFAPLNTPICPSGFVYFTYLNEMRLATLPPGYVFNEFLGMRWIPLELAPYFVQYHVESKTYAVVGTRSELCSSVYRLNAEGNKEEDVLVRPSTCVLPTLDHYVLQMYAPTVTSLHDKAWQAIPNTRILFEPWEVVTCVITAQLASEQTFHGTKDYLAIGANLSYGEEIPVRGRILIFDVIDVVPEPGQPLTRHKLKSIYDGEQKGPVTAMTSCQGHLISAIGQKVYIWTLKNGELVGVAFVDSELYIHSLLCVKNLVLAADVLKSIQLLRFQSDLRVLSVVSRDSIPREVFAANFFVDGRRLGFLGMHAFTFH